MVEAEDDAPHPNWDPHDERVPEGLRDAALGELHLVYHSSNYVFITELAHPDLGPGAAVYKPRRGEQPLYDFPDGLYEREIAAYEWARLLGWDVVPPTVAGTSVRWVRVFMRTNVRTRSDGTCVLTALCVAQSAPGVHDVLRGAPGR